jgi:hypothetical protein
MEYYRLQDTENARYGTLAASIFNSVPVDAKQARRRKWLEWKHFFHPLTTQRKPVENTAERAREDWERARSIGSFSMRGRK